MRSGRRSSCGPRPRRLRRRSRGTSAATTARTRGSSRPRGRTSWRPTPTTRSSIASLGGALVVEFVAPNDEMAQRLLAAKRPGLHADYIRDEFERLLDERFDV